MEQQKFKIQVPDGCSAKIEQQDGFLVVVVEQKKWEPKDGDIVAFGSSGIGIFKEFDPYGHTDYATLTESDTYINQRAWVNANIRPATDAEKQRLFDALAKKGKRWNPETKQIEDLPRWRAKIGEKYYFISDCLDVDFNSEDSDEYDDSYYAAGNYFKTEEAASRAAEKIRKILKESEAE